MKDIEIEKGKGPRPLEGNMTAVYQNGQISLGVRATFMGVKTVGKEGNKVVF